MSHQLGYLWAVTLLVWGGTCLYVMSLWRRQRQVERALREWQLEQASVQKCDESASFTAADD
ncbi:hypothetical protein GCM10025857_37890 [Alicyclobacillus contaminans]|uniref:hypothetical protein n=1 Tax=Alicyclobacillus contaminans TaxID=392016 RepID=UPI0003F65D8E|nr:hypothetical protein [Alicyclobacillus contaminans]GMA52432.1 hypothetical protein GCM10025857_37890 [Alicyclobacillus contaminans]